tara:strand:- start:1636 stop:2412 length:777 start_codon:yes stop_codon:yes gene_type:complete
MILSRIIHHLKTQNWTAVALEFVIVVAGVLLAFQVSAWNADWQRSSATATYYERLIEDLRIEERTMMELTVYYEEVRRNGLLALDAIHEMPDNRDTAFLTQAYQASQIRYYTPQRATYDELLSAGIATIIPDSRVRTLLANYYVTLENAKRTHDETTPYRDHLRTRLPYAIQVLIRENCGEVFDFNEDGSMAIQLVSDCEFGAPAELVERSMASLEEYETMENDLGRHLSNIDLKLASLEAYLLSTQSTLAAMEQAQP